MTPDQIERYARHIMLKDIGGAGQNKLLSSRAAIIGAGGLGGPAGLYLAAAGFGHIAVIDDDRVDASNLQRQIQFSTDDIGKLKCEAMAARMRALNPDCEAAPIAKRLTPENGAELLLGYDVVLDGVDDFASRFAINDAALALKIPLISGALGRFNGQVSVFGQTLNSPCYRCLVPDIPPDSESCAQIGVIGALAGLIGAAMAMEAIKLVTKAGQTLDGRLWLYNGLDFESRTVKLSRDPYCVACAR